MREHTTYKLCHKRRKKSREILCNVLRVMPVQQDRSLLLNPQSRQVVAAEKLLDAIRLNE